MEAFAGKIDVAINVHRKPYQTAVTLLSLLRHSSSSIDEIYFAIDAPKADRHSYDSLLERLSDRIVLFTPIFHLDVDTEWFYDVHQLGHTVANVSPGGNWGHVWASERSSGHSLLFDEDEYRLAEEKARALLEEEYG